MTVDTIQPGTRVRVTQQIPHLGSGRDSFAAMPIEGAVIELTQSKTGSWYAHSKDKKFWLDRLTLKKDDGEVVHVNLDQYTSVEVVEQF